MFRGTIEFHPGCVWGARDLAKCARDEQFYAMTKGSPSDEEYAQAVGDVIHHLLGDEGLVQRPDRLGRIMNRYYAERGVL